MTSTEFLERLCYLDMIETQHDRRDYMLASIVAEIRSFKNGFSEKAEPVSIKDCLLFPEEDGNDSEVEDQDEKDLIGEPEEKDLNQSRGKKDVPKVDKPAKRKKRPKSLEIGKPLDDKWKQVAANAKAVWAARFGIVAPPLEDPTARPEEDDGGW